MESLGNRDLLQRHKIGFLAGSKSQALSVLPTYDWAKEIAGQENVCVISGFQSPLEKDVLDFLLNGKCGIIFVMSRKILKCVPTKYKDKYDKGEILFISLEKENVRMHGRYQSLKRNKYIAENCEELVLSSLTEESSLNQFVHLDKSNVISIYH